MLGHDHLRQDSILTFHSPIPNPVQTISFVRSIGKGIGAPFPEIRRALRTGGLSILVSSCQYHHASALSKPSGTSISENILTNILCFLCRQGKASSEESRPVINCSKA